MSLTSRILARAYALAPQELDHAANMFCGTDWLDLTAVMDFQPEVSSQGTVMLAAYTTGGTGVGITGGAAGLPPETDEAFWIGFIEEGGDELFSMHVDGERFTFVWLSADGIQS